MNIIVFVFFSFLLIGQVKASNIEILMDKAASALNSGDCKTAIELYKKGANIKNARAEHQIGYMFYKGICVEKNINKAVQWYNLAASKNYAPSLFAMGNKYRKGEIVKKDLVKALEYYQKAAKLKYPNAQFNLALMYFNGLGAQKNLGLSFEWATKSAKQGYQPAKRFINQNKKLFAVYTSQDKLHKNLKRAAVTMAFLNHCVDIREGYQSVYINNIEYKKAKRKMSSLISNSSISGDKNKILEKFYKIMVPESMDKVMRSTTGTMMFMSSDYNPEVRKQCQNFLFIIRMGKDLSSLY